MNRLHTPFAVLGLATALVAGACSSGTSKSTSAPTTAATTDERVPGGTLTYAAEQEPAGLNINTSKQASGARNIVENLFFYAVKATPSYTLVYPGLEHEPTVVSTNPQVVEWKIKTDAKWSDGTPVTSEDLRYFYSQITDKNNDVAGSAGYDQISKLDVVDAKTIRATFSTPFADYRGLWEDVPQAAFMKAQPGGFNTGLTDNPGPSAGPFIFKSWTRGDSLTLVRNPNWWGPVKPTLDSIVFRFMPDAAQRQQALQNNEVQLVAPTTLTVDLASSLRAIPGIRSDIQYGTSWELVIFNTQNPILAALPVRQAIAATVDRNAIVDALVKPYSPDARRLDNFIYMTNQPQYEAHGAAYQKPDLAAAARLLDQAGWKLGSGNVREKDGKPLSLRMSVVSGNTLREQEQQLVINQLAAVGIRVEQSNCLSSCLNGTRLPGGDFDIAGFGLSGGTFPVSNVHDEFTKNARLNFAKFDNAQFDDLVAKAQSTIDATAQLALVNQMDKTLWDQVPGVPLFQRPSLVAVSDRYIGVGVNTTGDGPFWNTDAWGIKKGTK